MDSTVVPRWMRGPALALFASLAALAAAYVLFVEIKGRALLPINIDEIFFAVCAERARLADGGLVTGCHDNKGPGIYFLYQWIQAWGPSFDLLPLKLTSAVLVVITALTTWAVSGRMGASAGGKALATGLALWSFAYTPGLAAVKPDLVGSLLTLAALGLRLWVDGTRPTRRLPVLFCAGLLLGAAISVKQSFLFGVIGWMLGEVWQGGRQWRAMVVNILVVGLGVLVVPLGFVAWFLAHDLGLEALGSSVIYPALYGDGSGAGWLGGLLQRIYRTTGALEPYGLAVYLAAFLYVFGRASSQSHSHQPPQERPGGKLVAAILLGNLFFLLISPLRSSAYALTVTLLLSMWTGAEWTRLTRAQVVPKPMLSAGTAVLVFFAAQGLVVAWGGEAGNPLRDHDRFPTVKLENPPPYAYVAGVWPKMYWDNHMLPASSVMYPNAFGGLPSRWRSYEASADSWMGRQLRELRKRNLQRLMADFSRTPPGVIIVVDGEGRAPDSMNYVDIPVLESYMREHCRFDRRVDVQRIVASSYRCEH